MLVAEILIFISLHAQLLLFFIFINFAFYQDVNL